MKIAVATICMSSSPGAIYQSFAMCHHLESIDNIDLFVVPNMSRNDWGKTNNILKVLIRLYKKRYSSIKFYKQTVMYIPNHFRCLDLSQIDKNLDLLIVGSDQTFNVGLLGYRFFFDDYTDVRKISFSSSFGTLKANQVNEYLVKSLKTFDSLSFRENPSYLKFPSSIKYECHLDPTFLLSKEEWLDKLKIYKKRKNNYVLVFGLSEGRKTLMFAKQLAKEKGLKLVLTNYHGSNPLFGTRIINKDDPFELLSLIRDARYVVTHSYHGYIMSVLLNVDVFYYLAEYWNNSNYRFTQVIDVLSLPNRDISKCNSIDSLEAYDWKAINNKIEKERNRSINYLKDVINDKSM